MAKTAATKHPVAPRGAETLQLDIHYRGSPLASELHAHPGKVAAGDRAPDAPGLYADEREYRMFDLFRASAR